MKRVLILAVLTLPLGRAVASAADAPPPDARELMQKAIDARKALGSGKLVMTVATYRYAPNPEYDQSVRRWVLYFDGDKARGDVYWTDKGEDSRVFRRILTPDSYIEDDGLGQPVSARSYVPENTYNYAAFHPRVFGLTAAPAMTMGQYALDNYLLNSSYVVSGPAKPELVDGEQGWVCESHNKFGPGTTMKAWIVPSRNYAVTRIESDEGPKGDPRHLNVVSCDYKRFGETWFPSKIVVRQLEGTRLLVHEVTSVDEAEFGPVPADRFTLAGFGLPEGRQVRINGYDKKYWIDNSLQKRTAAAVANSTPPAPVETERPTVWWVSRAVAALLAVVGVILIVGWVRRTR